MSTFKMVVKSGEDPSIYDQKLVAQVNGLPSAGYVFTIYARLKDMDELARVKTLERRIRAVLLESEDKQGNLVSVYINKVNDDGYYQTTKLRYPKHQGVEVVNVPISPASFNHLSRISAWATPFERLRIPSADRKTQWVIDVFQTSAGKRHEWVKMDIEVEDLDSNIPKFPLEVEEYILDFPGEVTPEQTKFIKSLWERKWFSHDPQWAFTQTQDFNKKDD